MAAIDQKLLERTKSLQNQFNHAISNLATGALEWAQALDIS
jgi:hypothetical protein